MVVELIDPVRGRLVERFHIPRSQTWLLAAAVGVGNAGCGWLGWREHAGPFFWFGAWFGLCAAWLFVRSPTLVLLHENGLVISSRWRYSFVMWADVGELTADDYDPRMAALGVSSVSLSIKGRQPLILPRVDGERLAQRFASLRGREPARSRPVTLRC